MEVPVGFAAKLWNLLSFLPFFIALLILGLLKGIVIAPIVGGIIFIGNSAVIIGLWPAHVIWTYFCIARTKKIGLVLKILVMFLLPVPLALWLFLGIICSLIGGFAYGFIAPLFATFEAVGENAAQKCVRCILDGCWPTVQGACTLVRDLTDFCFHSYFSYMDELCEEILPDEMPMDIKLMRLPGSILVALLGMLVDVPLISIIAVWKSPYMLFRGWRRLFEDMVGREGPFLEAVCVPFAALSIILWPLAVIGAVLGAFFSSFFLGLYGGIVVHQENSVKMGMAYIIAIISIFDEYANDMLYLREGSCLPRPRYHMNMIPQNNLEKGKSIENEGEGWRNGAEGSFLTKLASQRSRTLKFAIQQYKPIQVWDWLFKSCEMNGKILLRDGLIDVKDIQKCILKGDCRKLCVKLPAWCILQCLLASAKSDSSGLLISDEMELTMTNAPREKVFEWFIEPLLIMKEQIKGLKLNDGEETCLTKLIMQHKNQRPEDWDESEFPSGDNVRRAQLQAILRRLQGIVGSMSRMPTFRRRFKTLSKILFVEAMQSGLLGKEMEGSSVKSKGRNMSTSGNNDELIDEDSGKHGVENNNNEEIV
ncbi:uncharacterized membrane protein At3g27390 [Impatiens glandulifera]|uniref:uncharacterized membrane protein At3g27390 n=1 Tax=Impatiens glandulifera TaxID=253017 RepID=UPI001FB12942|nr:uncharacterized membrane protein At3g27390 [Impatiens glandulifera]